MFYFHSGIRPFGIQTLPCLHSTKHENSELPHPHCDFDLLSSTPPPCPILLSLQCQNLSPALPLVLSGCLPPLPSIPNLLRFPCQALYFSQFAPTAIFPLDFPQRNPLLFFASFFLQVQDSLSTKLTHKVSSILPHIMCWLGTQAPRGTQPWGKYSHPLQISVQAARKNTRIAARPSFI